PFSVSTLIRTGIQNFFLAHSASVTGDIIKSSQPIGSTFFHYAIFLILIQYFNLPENGISLVDIISTLKIIYLSYSKGFPGVWLDQYVSLIQGILIYIAQATGGILGIFSYLISLSIHLSVYGSIYKF